LNVAKGALSDAASCIAGKHLAVDGGFHISI
jgi:hypothetical protein